MKRFTTTAVLRGVLASLLFALVGATGCKPPVDHSDRARRNKPTTSKKDCDKGDCEGVSVTKAEKTPRGVTSSSGRPVFQTKVMSHPQSTADDADRDALERAEQALHAGLAAFQPPIRTRPDLKDVQEHYLRKGSRVERGPTDEELAVLNLAKLDPNVKYVEYTVEITQPQLRQLRMLDRLVDALRVVGGLFVVSVAGFLFLRADEWTRGYLTSWLGILAGLGVVGGLVAVLTLG